MAQYDGSIRIVTKITTKDAKESLASLEWQIKKSAKYMDELRSKMDALKNQKIPTKEWKDLEKELSEAKSNLEKLIAKQTEWKGLGITSGGAWDSLNEDIAKAGNKIDLIKEKMQSLSDAGEDFTLGKDTAEYAAYTKQIQYEEEAAVKAGEKYRELLERTPEALERQEKAQRKIEEQAEKNLQKENKRIQKEVEAEAKIQAEAAEEQRLTQIRENAVVVNQRIVEIVERRKQLLKEIADLEKAGITAGYADYDSKQRELSLLNQEIKNYSNGVNETKENYKKLGTIAKKALSGIGSAISKAGNGIKKFGSFVKSVFSRLNKLAKKSSGLLGTLGSRFKGLALSLLIFNQISKAFNAMVSGIKEGFQNLYNENSKFKNSVDSLKASVLTLKNSFAAAFRPLVEIAIPYIQKAVEYITLLTDKIGQLIAAARGQKTYTKAVKQTADAFKDAGKAADGYLSPLDEINKYQSNKSREKKNGTGTMFEEVPVSGYFENILDVLKNAVKNSDFTSIGKMIGKKLENALNKIPWSKVKKSAGKAGKILSTLINGFIEIKNLGKTLGNTLAESINTAFRFFNSFVHNLKWESIGKFISDSINGFFSGVEWDTVYDTFVSGAKGLGNAINSFVDNLNWEEISNSISNYLNTFVDTIYTFITTADWKSIGKKFGTTLSDAWTGIDWSKAGKTVGEAFKSFFDFISETIENIDWWAVGESVKDFLVGIDWGNVADAFFEAVGAAIGGFAAFIGGLISDGLEDAKKYFQEKTEECGGNVVAGILKGIADAMVGIAGWLLEHVIMPIRDGIDKGLGGISLPGQKKLNFSFSAKGSPFSTLSSLPDIPIPRLATGAVIPANKEFLAVLGDQKHGTNVEAPLSTIEQAVENAMVRFGGSGGIGGRELTIKIPVIIDGRQITEIVVNNGKILQMSTGKNPFVLE